jgi:hypothetical protein
MQNELKYAPELYVDSGIFNGDMECDVEGIKEKLVKCRTQHRCMGGCECTIQPGEYAMRETGFLDGKPVSSYVCAKCIENWLEESGQVGDEHETE